MKLLLSFSWLISCRTFDNVSLNEFIVNMSAGSWTWVLILQQQRKGNWDKNFVRNNILLSFPILWNLHGNVMHFGKETKTNVLHLYFFFFFNWTTAVEYRRKNWTTLYKPISLHLCIISFFFKVKLYKKKFTTEKISNYWTRPNFTDCIKKGLGYMIVTVVTGSVMTV